MQKRFTDQRRGAAGTFVIQPLESRILMSTFSSSDFGRTLSVAAMNEAGTIVSDGNGNFVGGSVLHEDGTVSPPTGSYTVGADGTLNILGSPTLTGAISSSKNVAIASGPTNDTLTVIISGGSASFSDADLVGSWNLFNNGLNFPSDNPPETVTDNIGHGTLTFNGTGLVNYAHVTDESGALDNGSGVYTVAADGTVNVALVNSQGNPLNFTGAMNSSKDVIAVDATNLPGAASINDTRMVTLVQSTGTYSNADVVGNWTVCTDTGQGTLTFDAAGNITGNFLGNETGTLLPETVTGTETVAPDGTFTATITTTAPGNTHTNSISGSINASRNVILADQPNSGENGLDDMTVLVSSAAPLGANVSVQSTSASISTSQPVTLTATVSATRVSNNTLTGAVNFLDGGTYLGTVFVQADGTATFTTTGLTLGTHAFTATYKGDTTFSPANSVATNVVVYVPQTIGKLDPSFGTQGQASHNVGFTSTAAISVTGTQSVILGTVGTSPTQSFGVTRYNSDGSLDTTFGTGGVVTSSFSGTDDVPADIEVLSTGQILVAGTATTFTNGTASGSEFAIAKFNSDGSPDTTFGAGTGQELISFSKTTGVLSNDLLHALAVGPDGVIYLAGGSDANGLSDFAIAALNPDGSADTAFNATGQLLLDFAGGDDLARALVIQPNGQLVVAGSTATGGIPSVAIARLLTTGALDARFATGGEFVLSIGGVNDQATSLGLQGDGRIVVGGFSATGSADAGTLSADFLVMRLTAAGKLDRTFGNGPVLTDFGQPAAITSVVVQASGSIVASGKTAGSLASLTPNRLDVALARYTNKGVLDTSFNGTGKLIISLAKSSTAPVGSTTPPDLGSDLTSAFNDLINSSQGAVATTIGGEILTIGGNGTDTVEAKIIAAGMDLAATVLGVPPAAVIGGAKGTISVSIAEDGTTLVVQSVTIKLQLSQTTNGGGPISLRSFAEKIKLAHGKTKTYRLKFVYPTTLNSGNYYLLATVDTGGQHDLNVGNNLAASASAVAVAAPKINLTGSNLTEPGTYIAGKPLKLIIDITNSGNVLAKGSITIQFFASTDSTLTDAIAIGSQKLQINLKPGVTRLFHETLVLPSDLNLAAGTYQLLVLVDQGKSLGGIDVTDAVGQVVVSKAELTVAAP